MIPDFLLDKTARRFPRFLRDNIRIDPLEKGGSDRKYYRIAVREEGSLILVKYGDQREENRHYCEIDAFLKTIGVRVPTIYHHDLEEGLIWMEDLGEVDLWHFRSESWPVRRPLYRNAIEQVVRLHTRGLLALETGKTRTMLEEPQWDAALARDIPVPTATSALPRFQSAFDIQLYRWEQNYFFENCVARYFHVDPAVIEAKADRPRLNEIAELLAAQPRVLVHRDFQSQNIMVQNERAYLIDFQGMRPGLGQYDLASLLYDPYVQLTSSERDSLLGDYIVLCAEAGFAVPSDFRVIYDLCAMQRLMQALGAYGFLGLVKERTSFLKHIPTALASLREVAARIPGIENLRGLLDGL